MIPENTPKEHASPRKSPAPLARLDAARFVSDCRFVVVTMEHLAAWRV
jgi:hypothetical protein